MFRFFVASRLALVMLNSTDRLIADVAEQSFASGAVEHVRGPYFPVDLVAVRAFDDSLDVDVRILSHAHILFNHL